VRGGPTLHRAERYGDRGRAGVRLATVATAFAMLGESLG